MMVFLSIQRGDFHEASDRIIRSEKAPQMYNFAGHRAHFLDDNGLASDGHLLAQYPFQGFGLVKTESGRSSQTWISESFRSPRLPDNKIPS